MAKILTEIVTKIYKLLIAFLLLHVSHAQSQDADSLLSQLPLMPDNAEKLACLESICKQHVSVDTVFKYSRVELDLACKLDSASYQACAYDNLSWACHCQSAFDESARCRLNAIEIWDSLGNEGRLAFSYMNYATTLMTMKNDLLASDNYKTSLEIFIRLNDSLHVARVFQYLGLLNINNKNYDNAEDYYRKSLNINRLCHDNERMAYDYSGLAHIAIGRFHNQGDTSRALIDKSKHLALHAYDIAARDENHACMLSVIAQICDVYLAESELRPSQASALLDSCYRYYRDGIGMEKRYGYDFSHVDLQVIYIDYLIRRGDSAKAYREIKRTEEFILAQDDGEANLPLLYQSYIDYYVSVGNFAKAYEFAEKKYVDLESETDQINQSKLLQTKYQAEYSLKMRERMQAERERELMYLAKEDSQKQKMLLYVVALSLMAMLMSIILINSLKRKLLNRQLDAKNHQLESIQARLMAQNKLITSANRNMMSSIRYAKHIQEVAMPNKKMMESIFGECLIIYRPRDIVSGDFYWATEVGRYKVFAVADCTGHGVPGAFLSMLGISMLNDMVATINMNSSDISASMMLNTMRTNIRKALRQSTDDYTNQDGMDIALCLFDINSECLQYAGAFRPLLLIRNNEAIQYDADRMPIGAYMQLNKPFSNNIIDIEHGDVVYLYTDGITDQFNADDDPQKFTAPRLRDLILKNHELPFSNQQLIYEQKIDNWRTSPKTHQVIHQTDDMLMLAIRF